MKCPACGKNLSEIQAGSIKVQACKDGCAGIWVDHFQLEKINNPDEYDGELISSMKKNDSVKVDVEQKRHCPQCPDKITMMRHFYSVKREIVIDECPECGGYWLDMGELLKIRQTWKTDGEREKAAGDYFNALFGKAMAQDRAKDEVWETKARKVHDILRYICPSNYFKIKGWTKPS